MVLLHMNCIYCNSKKLYKLKSGQLKCSYCKKKFSSKKITQRNMIVKYFCENYTANQTAKKLHINYATVKKQYDKFRELILAFSEQEYTNKDIKQYDEYIYLEKSKKKIKENIFDAQNFITFNYENKIYNLLMPNLNRYKEQFLDDGMEVVYFKEFSKFMMFNKISKIQKSENIIQRFWYYFEEEMLKYKGIDKENFILYLKECEFKFNYTKDEAIKILIQLLHNKLAQVK